MLSASSEVFRALAEPTRRAIFERLSRDGEQTVHVLTDHSGVSQPAVSKHLGVLQLAGLVRCIPDPYRPWLCPAARVLDKQNLASWVDSRNTTPLCKHAAKLQFATDNGVVANKQSLLGVLALIKGGGKLKYFTETELYRCDGGNQQLAQKLAEPILETYS